MLIEGILILVIVGLLGGTGWYVWHSKNNADKSAKNAEAANSSTSTSSKKQTSTTTTADPYAGWKTYTSSMEGFTFKYPNTWTLKDTYDSRSTNVNESIALSGTNNFSLIYDVYKLNTNSNFGCDGCSFNGVSALTIENYGKSLYMVVNSNTVNGQPYQTLGISEYKTLNEQQYKGWIYYSAKKNPGYVVRWSGDYVKPATSGGELIYYTYDDFVKQPEVVTAKQILQSLSY